MYFKIFKPCLPLSAYVQHIMVANVTIDPNNQSFKPFPPAPEQTLYFYPWERVFQKGLNSPPGFQPFSIIVGPQVSRVDLRLGINNLMIGIVFRPGALYRILGIPMRELFDRYLDSSLIWPSEIRVLQEKMNETDNYELMVEYAQKFLLERISHKVKQVHPIDEVFDSMIHSRKKYSIDQLADLACLSPRQFNRKFYDRIGMSPKVFERVIRFSKATRMKESLPEYDWLSIALATGYHDFQHLLRDFREFTGTTPTALREQDLGLYAYKLEMSEFYTCRADPHV